MWIDVAPYSISGSGAHALAHLSDWQRRRQITTDGAHVILIWVSIAIAAAIVCFVALAYAKGWPWTGFTEGPKAPRGKTLWHWLDLLVVPLALASVAFALNAWQSGRDGRRDDRRAATQRAQTLDARREDVLRSYLQSMSGLMLQDGLLRSRADSAVRRVARTLTLTALRRLDAERKAVVVRFLLESRLIETPDPRVDLRNADLRRVSFRRLAFEGHADFDGSMLQDADFREASFERVSFAGARLDHADFSKSHFGFARVARALSKNQHLLNDQTDITTMRVGTVLRLLHERDDLTDQIRWVVSRPGSEDVRRIRIRGQPRSRIRLSLRTAPADFTSADLYKAHFDGAFLPSPSFLGAKLDRVSFRGAFVTSGDFSNAQLRYANFDDAYVGHGDFDYSCVSHAHFKGANLFDAKFDAQGSTVDFSKANVQALSLGLDDMVVKTVVARRAMRDDRTVLTDSKLIRRHYGAPKSDEDYVRQRVRQLDARIESAAQNAHRCQP